MREVSSGENILIDIPIRQKRWAAMRDIINNIIFIFVFCYIRDLLLYCFNMLHKSGTYFPLLVVCDQLREVYVTREHKYHEIIKAKGEDKCFMSSSNPIG